jgi:hypothetical protein
VPSIGAPIAADFPDWRELYEGYAAFYRVPMTDAIAARLFAWLLDPAHVLEGRIARDAEGRAIGLAHFRAMPRPLAAAEIGFLDDLFVGWTALRWITAADNATARALYDRLARATHWVTYELKP